MNIFITGVNGQDGSYLAEYHIRQGNVVWGLVRRSSTNTFGRLKNIMSAPNFHILEGDVCDMASLEGAISKIEGAPHKIFHLAAQSFVGASFEQPIFTVNCNMGGTLNLLEIVRKQYPKAKFYHAGTSESFGVAVDADGFQRETTPFCPQSPYAIAKVAAIQMTKLYRESYGLFACSGILFNHESVRRGEQFVTKKVVKYVADLKRAIDTNAHISLLNLGNLDARRDWGAAYEYVVGMDEILNGDKPDDYVIATGETHSVRELCQIAFSCIGIEDWPNYVVANDKDCVRPSDVPYLKGDCSKIKEKLGWYPTITFNRLITEMVEQELNGDI